VLLAVAMGLQRATGRNLGVPGLTAVLTTTLMALAADSTLAGGKNPDLCGKGRRRDGLSCHSRRDWHD
jgi:hypothetical protein